MSEARMAGRSRRRLAGVRRGLSARKVQALLVGGPANVNYLVGVGDIAWLYVGPRGAAIMPVPLSAEAAARAARGVCAVLEWEGGWGVLARLLRRDRVRRLGMEGEQMSASAFRDLERGVSAAAVVVPSAGIVEALRERKDQGELALLRRAGAVAGAVAGQLPWIIRPGMTERDLAGEIDRRMLLLGAEGPAFDTIALFAARTALPHGVPSGRRARPGDLCLVDFGARVERYCSDVTRVLVVGSATRKQERLYAAVFRAYSRGRREVRPGARAEAADRAARSSLGRLAPRFIHSLGHGVGLQVHEGFRLGKGVAARFRPGNVVTVEPGIYFPGWGGIRLEDTVEVAARGSRSLTGSPPPGLPGTAATR